MTKIHKVGSNVLELHNDKGIILFSYETPVAAQLFGTHGHNSGLVKT